MSQAERGDRRARDSTPSTAGTSRRILALAHTDFEAVVPPELSAEPDTYRGHDGIRRLLPAPSSPSRTRWTRFVLSRNGSGAQAWLSADRL